MDLKTAEKAIAKVLVLFYVNIRKKDQTLYKRNSYLSARSAIHHHLMSIRHDIDLLSSAEIKRSNEVLDGILKEKKKGEEPAVQHKDSITDADWKLIEEYFTDIQDQAGESTSYPHRRRTRSFHCSSTRRLTKKEAL